MRIAIPLLLALFTGCAAAHEGAPDPEEAPSSEAEVNGTAPVAKIDGCTTIGETPVPLATADADGEAILTLDAQSISRTSWAEAGNEAVVLEVLTSDSARVGHILLHQGADAFGYGMHLGVLKKGDALSVRVSSLTAPKAARSACIAKATIAAPSADIAEGVVHAPIFVWPVAKAFNDVPVLVGWSGRGKGYQLTYTNEDGGTVDLCGGGARGMRSEIARWGRGLDMEGGYSYGGEGKFGRCSGGGTVDKLRMEQQHPRLYYGNGHNNLFESRGGYGQACGTKSDVMANGQLEGWNKNNPGNELEKDDPFTIVLRPIPVRSDAIANANVPGRREGIVDTYAPWLYRLVDSELKREGRVDEELTFSMNRYLFVDVYADDVGGSGDETCGPVPGLTLVTGGFRLNAIAKDGTVSKGPQMTADFFGGGSGVKRIAIPLAPNVKAADIAKLTFDAYDGDGIYFLGIGDAFVPRASGSNSAVLDYVHEGEMLKANVYVDDDNSGCTDGKNTKNGVSYPCSGSLFTLPL